MHQMHLVENAWTAARLFQTSQKLILASSLPRGGSAGSTNTEHSFLFRGRLIFDLEFNYRRCLALLKPTHSLVIAIKMVESGQVSLPPLPTIQLACKLYDILMIDFRF